MATQTFGYARSRPARVQYSGWTWLVLGVLLVGPLVGPVFQQIGWPLLAWVNWPLYLMGENACPQPDLTLQVFGYPMLVCSRCWAGVFGLWTVLLTYKASGGIGPWSTWLRLPELARVSVALLAFGPWVLDIIAADQGWWISGQAMLILSGLLGGLGAGALLLPYTTRRADRPQMGSRTHE